MRLLILVTASTLVLTGTVMADQSVQTDVVGARHHYRDANASIAEGSAPADAATNEVYAKNLRDSGYNRAGDFDAAGNMKVN